MKVPKEARGGTGCPGAGVTGIWKLLDVVQRTHLRSPVRVEGSELLSSLPGQSQTPLVQSQLLILTLRSHITLHRVMDVCVHTCKHIMSTNMSEWPFWSQSQSTETDAESIIAGGYMT